MGKFTKKQRLSAYLDRDVMAALADYATKRQLSLSEVAEAAIASFLSPDGEERREAALIKRLDQIDRRLARLERDTALTGEALAVFVRFWLTSTPQLPEPAHSAAIAKAGDRYDAFVAAVGRRMASGQRLRGEVVEESSGNLNLV